LPESRVEAFLRRAGIDADAALRARAEAFLAGRGLGASALARVPDGLARAWGRCLAAGLPIDYRELMTAPAMPLPEGADFAGLLRLAAVLPSGAAAQSLVVDFERGVWYADETWPVFEDVCRAAQTGAADAALRGRLAALLAGAGVAGWRPGAPEPWTPGGSRPPPSPAPGRRGS